jgi:Antibiotic biosynthesis monooxygenase
MFIAMNRFRIASGREQDFESIWRNRQSYLEEVPGFIESLLRGSSENGAVLRVAFGMEKPEGVRRLDQLRIVSKGARPGPSSRGNIPRAATVRRLRRCPLNKEQGRFSDRG